MILAIETGAGDGSVALWREGRVLGSASLDTGRRHAATVLTAIDGLLSSAGASLEDVRAIALSIGPGSFTALRIGLSTALGLCFATDRLIVPVGTLAALACRAPSGAEPVAAVLDARKSEVYVGVYAADGRALEEDRVADPASWARAFPGNGPVWLVGSGSEHYAGALRDGLGDRARFCGPERAWPRARDVAVLGAAGLARGLAMAPERVELRYLRSPDAEAALLAGQPQVRPVS